MPAYDFDLVHEGTGEVLATVPVILPVEQRDKLTLQRRTVPRSLIVAGSAPDKPGQGREVLRSYYQQEQKLGSRFRRSKEFTASQIREAWKD